MIDSIWQVLSQDTNNMVIFNEYPYIRIPLDLYNHTLGTYLVGDIRDVNYFYQMLIDEYVSEDPFVDFFVEEL